MSLSSPSYTKTGRSTFVGSPKHTKRVDSSSVSRTKVELHQVDVLLQKEIGRLERQQNAAVSNIANHQQAMKMSWRKLEQRRLLDSPLLTNSRERTSSSPSPKRGLFHSNTKLHAGQNVWGFESAPSLSETNIVGSETVKVTGDIYHRRFMDQGCLPLSPNKKCTSPYVSTPNSVRRRLPRQQDNVDAQPGASSFSSTKPVVANDPSTSDKGTLLKAFKLMGLECSSHSPHNFKEFYSIGVEESASAASVKFIFTYSNSEDKSSALQTYKNDLTMAQMFDQIKHCRYIRRYHPNGSEQ